MRYTHNNRGTCSTKVEFDINDNVVTNVQFTGGCNGNLQGVCALVDGMTVEQIIEKLDGIKCGFKSTSCPDQLAQAVKEAAGM